MDKFTVEEYYKFLETERVNARRIDELERRNELLERENASALVAIENLRKAEVDRSSRNVLKVTSFAVLIIIIFTLIIAYCAPYIPPLLVDLFRMLMMVTIISLVLLLTFVLFSIVTSFIKRIWNASSKGQDIVIIVGLVVVPLIIALFLQYTVFFDRGN